MPGVIRYPLRPSLSDNAVVPSKRKEKTNPIVTGRGGTIGSQRISAGKTSLWLLECFRSASSWSRSANRHARQAGLKSNSIG